MRHICEFVNGQCFECGEMDRKIDFAKPQNVSKEWAKLFLEQWNRAVELWDGGYIFSEEESSLCPATDLDQREYARICCTWLIPNGFVEPHCVAEGG